MIEFREKYDDEQAAIDRSLAAHERQRRA